MALISSANLTAFTDKLGASYKILKENAGLRTGSALTRTIRYLMEAALAVPVNSDDYQLQADLNSATNTAKDASVAEALGGFMQGPINALNTHVRNRGPATDSSLVNLGAYLAYLNTTGTGTPWSVLMVPEFGELYYAVLGSHLVADRVMSPSISPLSDATAYPNGMGLRAVGGSFTDGVAVADTSYAEVEPLLVVTADFSGGSAAPQIAVAGLNDEGAAATWNITLDSSNPTSAIATTITPSTTAMARQTVAFASAAGIVRGSVLKVSAGLVDEETIIVELVAGSNITAVFNKAHAGGAAVTGLRTYAIAPPAANNRLRNGTNITLTVAGHSAGTVRIDGRQDRVGV